MFKQFRVSGTVDHVYVRGDVNQSAKLNADGFFKALLALPSYRCLDLLRIATAIYVVDRISKRIRRPSNEEGIRRLKLVFEVRDIEFWSQTDVNDLLTEILTFLTDDDWSFAFELEARGAGDVGHQDFLPLPRPFEPRNAALYSEGLDSCAGLANSVLEGRNNFLLVTVGHQSGLHRRVETQLNELTEHFKKHSGIELNLLHSTLTTSLEGGKSRRIRLQEQTQRSRAFLFCSAATIAANAYGLKTVAMFENGVGAINLPLMTGMLGGILSTRGAHPTFLGLMSTLSEKVTEKPSSFVLPYESKTKAEMLRPLVAHEGLPLWVQKSRSCVHTSIRQATKTHCGRCPGCIERRQAFASARIEEVLDIYQTNIFTESLADQNEADYLRLYQLDAMNWVKGAESVRRRMKHHLRLTNTPDSNYDHACELQSRHSQEVLSTFGSPYGSAQ